MPRLARPPRCLLLAALAAGLLASHAPSARAEGEDVPSRFFDRYDRDDDGRVTPQELQADDEVFRVLDRNQDGVITQDDLGPPADYRPRRPRREGGDAAGGGEGGRPAEGPAGRNKDAASNRAARLRARLQAMDANGDGRVTREEFEGQDRVFEALDRNGDGVLDRRDAATEDAPRRPGRSAPTPEMMKQRFERLDENGDGKLDAGELPRPAFIQRADGDGDGTVSLEEFQRIARRAGTTRRGGGGRRPSAQAFRRFDRDGDGKVGRDEFPGSDERFDQLDTNGDGSLTDADRKATAADGSKKEEGAPPEAGDMRRRDDVNGDGRVSRREFQGTDEAFDDMDKNRDGFLDEQDER